MKGSFKKPKKKYANLFEKISTIYARFNPWQLSVDGF
jgi:hypothetical protein